MTHVFVAPHPDDVALSCGGLVASLRELGQSVTILTVYSGGPAGDISMAVHHVPVLVLTVVVVFVVVRVLQHSVGHASTVPIAGSGASHATSACSSLRLQRVSSRSGPTWF